MEAPKSPGDPLLQLASGIEAGVIGGLAMLLLMVSGSLLRGHPWLEVPNLLGSTFYGLRAFRQGASLATLSGTALHFVITGAIGASFGLIFGRVRDRGRLIIFGLLAGAAWYYLADILFWNHVNTLVPLYGPYYSPPVATFLAHGMFGACLGFMGREVRQLAFPPPLEQPPPAQDPAQDNDRILMEE